MHVRAINFLKLCVFIFFMYVIISGQLFSKLHALNLINMFDKGLGYAWSNIIGYVSANVCWLLQ